MIETIRKLIFWQVPFINTSIGLLIVIALVILFTLWGLSKVFNGGKSPSINQAEIERINRESANVERTRIEEKQDASRERVDEIDAEIKQAEANTNAIKSKDYSNVSNDELKRRLEEKARNR